MELKSKILVYSLSGLLVVAASFAAIREYKHRKQITALHNEIAEHQNTIEVNKNVWMKNAQEVTDIKKLLDTSKEEQKKLLEELKKKNLETLALSEVNIKLKKDYEAVVKNAKQTEIAGVDGGSDRTKVEFEKEFGPYKVSGYTLTNPGEAVLKLSQIRPLRITVSVNKQNDGKWTTLVASSEDDMAVDIKVNAVQPSILEKKWYEKIGFMAQVGGGTASSGAGALLGAGITYEIGKFTIGPSVLFSTTGLNDRFYTANVIWNAFKK